MHSRTTNRLGKEEHRHRGAQSENFSSSPLQINPKENKGQLAQQEKAPLRERSCFSEGVSASQVGEHLSEALQTRILRDLTVTSLPSVTEGDF